jgi:hypothetical protein
MAQEEMVKLLHLKNDYSFTKIDELNTIDSLSFNNNDLYYFANRYYKHFDHRKIKEDFIDFNTNFFIGVYFMFAPLLTIPIYQQTRYYDIASKKGDQGHSHLSLESKINLSLDKNLYFHHDSKTENILKAQRVSLKNNIETDIITSYGFQTRFRVVIITVIDFEAGAVPVPVTVIDYIPVSKQTTIETKMKENESDLKKQEINFAIASAILASSMPKEFKPDKEALLKTKPKKDTKK